jgi:hypothetical protein
MKACAACGRTERQPTTIRPPVKGRHTCPSCNPKDKCTHCGSLVPLISLGVETKQKTMGRYDKHAERQASRVPYSGAELEERIAQMYPGGSVL